MGSHRFILGLLATTLSFVGCSFSSKLSLVNETAHPMIPYPVVTDPPPPHREADPGAIVPIQGKRSVPTGGFYPLYYSAGVLNPQRPNALYLGLDFYDDSPPQILYRVMHMSVPPGQEGQDPELQPVVLKEELVTITDVNHVIVVDETVTDESPVPVWKVTIQPAASDG